MQKTINFGPFMLNYLHLAIFFGPLNLGHFKFRKLHFESMWKSNSYWENSVQRHLVMSTSYFVTKQVIIVSLISGPVSLSNFYSSLTPRQKKLECLSLRRRSERAYPVEFTLGWTLRAPQIIDPQVKICLSQTLQLILTQRQWQRKMYRDTDPSMFSI